MPTLNPLSVKAIAIGLPVSILGVTMAFSGAFYPASFGAARREIPLPTPDITSPTIPMDVSIPAGFAGNPIGFFDDYSWRAFIALVWPVQSGQRGEPATSLTVDGPGPRVFETYKAVGEVFHQDGSSPAAWNEYDAATHNPCSETAQFGDIALGSFSKFSDVGQASFGKLVGGLPSQNGIYAHYLTGFNKIEFDKIITQQWYTRSKLNASVPVIFPNGAVDIKSSWIDMANIPHPERYYTRSAMFKDPATGACAEKTVGLVGLHIVQKTPSRPQWIWSTFEHIDTVPPAQQGGPNTFAFNDGMGGAMPNSNPNKITPLTLPPIVFNVQRLKPIHTSTQATNDLYQKALRDKNPQSKWQFYRLVMTQWPTSNPPDAPVPPDTPGDPAHTFPGSGADTTSFANTTMETFDQKTVVLGCMNCHTQAQKASDFLWSLEDHAFPPNIPAALPPNSPRARLRKLLELAQQGQPPPQLRGNAQPAKRPVPPPKKKISPRD